MNLTLVLYQKIRELFYLENNPDKFEFALPSFTTPCLEVDDFNFQTRPEATQSAAQAIDNYSENLEFSTNANTPAKDGFWSPSGDGENCIWRVYQEILTNGLKEEASLVEWQNAKDAFDDKFREVPSLVGGGFCLTDCAPNEMYRSDNPLWRKMIVSQNDLVRLDAAVRSSFSPTRYEQLSIQNIETNLDIASLDFEILFIDIKRPWFNKNLLLKNNWKFPPSETRLLSSGNTPNATDILPNIPVKWAMIRNINVKLQQNSQKNTDFITKVQNGQVKFGMLMMQSIPKNISAQSINELRLGSFNNTKISFMTHQFVFSKAQQYIKIENKVTALDVKNTAFDIVNASKPTTNVIKPSTSSVLVGNILSNTTSISTIKVDPIVTKFNNVGIFSQMRHIVGEASRELKADVSTKGERALMNDSDFVYVKAGQVYAKPAQSKTVATTFDFNKLLSTDTKAASLVSKYVFVNQAWYLEAIKPVPNTTPRYLLRGSVKEDNSPSSGAKVELYSGNISVQAHLTGSDGKFSFDDVIAGRYMLIITKEGFETQTKVIDVSQNKVETPDVIFQLVATNKQFANDATFFLFAVISEKLPLLPNPNPNIQSFI